MKKISRSMAGVLMALSLLASASSGPAAAFGAGTDIEINTEEGGLPYASEYGIDIYGQETAGNAEAGQEPQGGAAETFEVSDGAAVNDGTGANGEAAASSDGSSAETGSGTETTGAGTVESSGEVTGPSGGSEVTDDGTTENSGGITEPSGGTEAAEDGGVNTGSSESSAEGQGESLNVPGQTDEELPQELENGAATDGVPEDDAAAGRKNGIAELNDEMTEGNVKKAIRE